jgi:hypothetical protein
MDADEREVFDFLSNYGEEWISAKEICRRAGGKRRFYEDNNWAIPALKRLKDSHAIENDQMGRYRIPPAKEKEQHISDEAEKLLRESGIQVDAQRADAASGEHHEQD